jgi:short-subunit dehydrogenase
MISSAIRDSLVTGAAGYCATLCHVSTLKAQNIVLSLIIIVLSTSCATSRLGKSGQEKINGKTYVIVGASSGFGRGMAEELGKYRANVVVAARRTNLLNEVATNVRSAGGKALLVSMDISKPDDVQRLADAAINEFGNIDVWVNIVGVGAIGRFWEIPLEDQARVIDVNLKGFLYGSYAAIQQFKKQRKGTLINMGSIDSETPLAYQTTYSASKAAVRSLSLALSQELRLNDYKEIKVVTVEPWAVDTPWWRHAANYSGGTPRMAWMDNPEKVVNALLRVSLRPRKELAVGWKAKGSWFFHHLFPRLTERISANVAHRYQIETAPPAPDTTGAIYEPMKAGRGVEDGVKERIKREKKERKMRKKGDR